MKSFDERRALVKNCTRLGGPSVYRTLYGLSPDTPALDIATEAEWEALPCVTKDIFLATPFEERTFLPLSEVDYIVSTSGTSGKPPLFAPRARLSGFEHRLRYYSFDGACLISLGYPHKMEGFFAEIGRPPRVVQFDARRARASIRLAKAQGVDNLFVHSFLLPLIGEEMEKAGINERVRYIEISGETCSQTLFRYIRTTFPNAVLAPFYGATEVEDSFLGVPCEISVEKLNLIFHEKETGEHHIELIDPETGAVRGRAPGTEGEAVVTASAPGPFAFPMIRYRMGDRIRVEKPCAQHGTFTFSVLGREHADFIRLTGGVIRADAIARVLNEMGLSDRFELHVYMRDTGDGEKPAAILHLEQADDPLVAETIARELRVGPTTTYADAVKKGFFEPLTCAQLVLPPHTKKHVRMVRHEA